MVNSLVDPGAQEVQRATDQGRVRDETTEIVQSDVIPYEANRPSAQFPFSDRNLIRGTHQSAEDNQGTNVFVPDSPENLCMYPLG